MEVNYNPREETNLLLFEGKKNIVVLTKPRPYASAFVFLKEHAAPGGIDLI